VPFAFRDSESELRACKPIIELDAREQICGVRFSNRHVQPMRLSYSDTVAFYAAYRCYADLDSLASALATLRREVIV
jgi:gamma-butyrobetaine dioxygenase